MTNQTLGPRYYSPVREQSYLTLYRLSDELYNDGKELIKFELRDHCLGKTIYLVTCEGCNGNGTEYFGAQREPNPCHICVGRGCQVLHDGIRENIESHESINT